MRILFVSPFDFGYQGGVNEHITQLDHQFRAMGHQTRIIAPTSPDTGETDDGHVYRVGMAIPVPSNESMARVTFSPTVTWKVRQFMRGETFDVVHLHEPLTPILCSAVLLYSDVANVGTFHAARPSNVMYMYLKPVLDLFFDKLDARVAVSEAAREFVDSYFPSEYEIIPNGISLDRFHGQADPLPQFMDGRPNILFVGRFNEPRKGFRYLIRAMPMIRSQFPDARLIVVGQGATDRYEHFLHQHGIDDVVFAGFVSADELPRYYASCDVFVAPSTGRESFGLILLEAMASGKPVIASSIAGYSAVVRDGLDGVLVEPKNPQALALAIVRVLADVPLRERLTTSAREHVKQFSWAVVAERLIEVYQRAIVSRATDAIRQPWPAEIVGRRG
ncbi:MAG TPA: glycosyltransferase family 4 protein [Thermomicrobiales bacterium]|nr:glycosyltransferase family 1 protein [Chloroflexota bacterium]HCG30531.1 glycosyltransferase family 1 protein [Chloroflexota bacterium]HQX62228.1 glycosyltransferase family 4 protein [Thermomicrobiales bacterium]HQZ90247.1 glycosyltransferase family 4 protein [Thermomicrobiales bacterium]HRA30681.1 glycosyltransferase family 4 protein [Thermomicrobiales bacterium]